MTAHNHLDIIKRLCDHGCQTYLAGGGVRDMLSGEEPKDFDIVTAATPDTIIKLFHDCKTASVGKHFGVVLVNGYEVATFRRISRYDKPGTDVLGNTTIFARTIQEDLSRRDFTINAMAYCEFTGEIIDEYGGRSDLARHIIRFVGDPQKRIDEDPHRIIRACRFLAKFQGEFDLETRSALEKNAHLIKYAVAPERIRMEILKAMELEKPSLFFIALHTIDALQYIFPSMVGCVDHPHGRHHLEDVFVHLLIAGDSISSEYPLLRLAAYLHDVGKPAAYKEQGDGSFAGHDVIGADILTNELLALKFSNAEIDKITSLVSMHMRPIRGISDKGVRRFLKKLVEKDLSFEEFLTLRIADRAANRKRQPYTEDEIAALTARIHDIQNSKVPLTVNALAISGGELIGELHLSSGPLVGEIQRYLLDQVIEQGQTVNTYDSLLLLARKYLEKNVPSSF